MTVRDHVCDCDSPELREDAPAPATLPSADATEGTRIQRRTIHQPCSALPPEVTIQGVQHSTNLLIVTSVFFGAIEISSSFNWSGEALSSSRRRFVGELFVEIVELALRCIDGFFRHFLVLPFGSHLVEGANARRDMSHVGCRREFSAEDRSEYRSTNREDGLRRLVLGLQFFLLGLLHRFTQSFLSRPQTGSVFDAKLFHFLIALFFGDVRNARSKIPFRLALFRSLFELGAFPERQFLRFIETIFQGVL